MKASKKILPREEWPYEVPGNWVWTRLEHIAEWGSGGTPSRKQPQYYKGSIPWIKTGELNDGRIYDAEEKITQEALNNSSAKIFPKHSVLIAMYGATIGKTAILEIPAASNQACACAIPIDEVDYLFLFYFLRGQKDDFIANAQGGAQPNISQAIIKRHPFPLAPLSEQQRIVARIESLFAKLDAAAEKIRAALDQFPIRKAAILHKAFTGELTKKWREENGVGMESWKRKKFEELGETRLGKMLDKEKNQGKATKYLRNVNVRWFSFSFDDMLSILVTEDEREKLSIEDGDLLICEGGEPGRCAVWTHGKNNYVYQKALHRFRPYSEHSSQFMAYYLHYLSINGKLEIHFTGTTIKHLTGKALALLPCPAPVYSEQKEIVRILDNIFAREQTAKEAAERLLERVALTKKSILARAFRGKLGTNDPTEESAERWLSQGNTVSLQAY